MASEDYEPDPYADPDDVSVALDIHDDFNLVEDGAERDHTKQAPPQMEWFHGKMNRDDASKLLIGQSAGAYLLRESVRNVGDYSISFRVEAGVKHFKVIAHEYGDFYIADNRFTSLSELVEFYCNEFLCDNLCLEFPIAPAGSKPIMSGQARRVVVATQDYGAQGTDEISFRKGDRLTVLNDKDEHWIWASHQGSAFAGFAPRKFTQDMAGETLANEANASVQLPSHFHRSKWLHGVISRPEAESLLNAEGEVGSFLIRESTKPVGDFSLSFRGPKKVQHFKIHVADSSRYECGGRSFDCLEAIVLRYMKESLMDDTCLSKPLPSASAGDDDDDFDVDGDLYSDVQYPAARRATAAPGGAPPKPAPVYEPLPKKDAAKSNDNASVKMGYIVKKAKKTKKWKPMFFALIGQKRLLYYFDSNEVVKPKGIIDLPTCFVYSIDDSFFGRPHCFQIIVNTSEIYLCANTKAEKQEWMQALGEYALSGAMASLTDNKTKVTASSINLSIQEAKDFGKHASPYCFVSLNGFKTARTPSKATKNGSAFWGESFVFDDVPAHVEELGIDVMNRGKRKDQLVAQARLMLSQLPKNEVVDKWVNLTTPDGSAAGTLRIKVTYKSEVILPVKDYKELSKAVCNPDLGAANAIASVSRNQLNDVARSLLTIWRAQDDEVKMLCLLNKGIVDAEEKVATLFRGNSLASKAMDQYMKMIAIPYLQSTIGDAVRLLFAEKRSCELDSTRSGYKADNLKVLISHAKTIAELIFASADNCPKEIRHVFQQLQQSVIKKFPKDRVVPFTSISAFLFLRLFCPAILNPKLFNMMPDHPTELSARNLTLVAKVIQNLANLSKFGQKEPYMIPCNAFLEQQHDNMKTFINTICTDQGEPAAVPKASSISRDLAFMYRICASNKDAVAKAAGNLPSSAGTLPKVIDALTTKL